MHGFMLTWVPNGVLGLHHTGLRRSDYVVKDTAKQLRFPSMAAYIFTVAFMFSESVTLTAEVRSRLRRQGLTWVSSAVSPDTNLQPQVPQPDYYSKLSCTRCVVLVRGRLIARQSRRRGLSPGHPDQPLDSRAHARRLSLRVAHIYTLKKLSAAI